MELLLGNVRWNWLMFPSHFRCRKNVTYTSAQHRSPQTLINDPETKIYDASDDDDIDENDLTEIDDLLLGKLASQYRPPSTDYALLTVDFVWHHCIISSTQLSNLDE